jgi:hypothetical protein
LHELMMAGLVPAIFLFTFAISHCDQPPAVIAGLDPAIPIVGHGRAILSGMAGSNPAMTIPPKSNRL